MRLSDTGKKVAGQMLKPGTGPGYIEFCKHSKQVKAGVAEILVDARRAKIEIKLRESPGER